MKQISARDRMERNKYMGVWRWKSELTARMISRFPSTVTRYMDRNSPKRRGCRSGSSESSFRWNSETSVTFFVSLLLSTLLKKKRKLLECETNKIPTHSLYVF
jgi:hypothetical protein